MAMLVLASADTVRAAASDDAQKFRNPIEWLLSDIGKLFSGATSKKSQNTEPETVAAPPVQPAPAKAPVPKTEPSPSAPAQAAEEKTFRNPISWLLRDLARILQPDLEIDQSPPADTVAAKPTAETAAAPGSLDVATTVPEPRTPDISGETETAADDRPTAAGERPSNPITWLFRDLARLFAPASDGTEVATAAPAVEPASAAEPVAASISDPEPTPRELARDTQDAEPQISDMTASAKTVEVAPWVPHPEKNPFDPNESLFASNGVPMLPAPAASAEPETALSSVQTAEVAEVHEQPEIRKRAPYRPERRNRAALGQEHKTVTPDPGGVSLVDRVLEGIFGIDEPVDAEETVANKVSDRIVPEESLDLGYTSPDAHISDHETTRLEDGPITQLDLYMGKDSAIGTPYDAAAFKTDSCVERALHGSVFCLKSLNWPAHIASSFAADTAFLLPGEGVVRYENGTASRVYAVFKAQDFAEVVKFMQQRFGPPQEREIGWMHMLEAPKLPNTTFRWQAFSADRRDAIVLEVRNYDDLRRSFADMEHGMVRLYRAGSRPIFKHISTMDLMLMQRRRVAHAPVEVNTPPKQQ
ncbi:MAG: hypothetical protein ACFE0S_01045 [Rhodospirillales bacterium]